jgi:hypothetical protein
MISLSEAKKRGFKIDDTCYPWVAYKGNRFLPKEFETVSTNLESQLIDTLQLVCDNHNETTKAKLLLENIKRK